ncbi:MAG: restriction endonuclease subunit S [bacterium]|nr:restriction endonuclease subunit S [bacterium]
MKLETFFEKYDQFAGAPEAVGRMRELVLNLAVTGKLVAQDDHDEPASLLMERAQAERAKLVAARKIKSRPSVPVEPSEQPYELPSSWVWARLLDVGHELGQKVPDKRFTYIDVGGIDSGEGRISERVEVLEPGDAPSRARKLVIRGTVIYSTVRPYLLNIAIVDQEIEPEPIASTAFGILHPLAGIYNRYLFYWLRSAPFTEYVQAAMKGMAYPAINDGKFYGGPVAVPPLAEQRRIVAKVDELMALCDRLEAQQQECDTRHTALACASLARFADAPTPENLDFLFHKSYDIDPADLRKSILTLAVQGKLVPQDPKDEPAEESLAEIKKLLTDTGRQRRKAKASDAASHEEPFQLPAGWAWAGFPELGEFGRGKSKHRPRNDPILFSGGSHRLIQTGDVARANGTIQTHTGLYNDVGLAQSRMWPAGTLCITIAANIADSGILGFDACFPDSVVGFIPAEPIPSVRYFEYFMRTAKEDLERFAPSTAQKNINLGILERVTIPIPPLAEQRRIVVKVDQLMALVDEMETQLAASRATAKNLLEGLVAELTATGSSSDEGSD